MKYFAIPFILLATLLQACVNKEPSIEHDSLMEASKQELAAALEERDRLLDLVKEISSDMDQIKHLEHIMTVAGAQSFENPAQRAQLLSDMAAVKKTLQNRREKLAELEARLQESSLYTEELKSTVEVLRKQIDSQTEDIESLRAQLSRANERISSLNSEVDSLNCTVATVNRNLDDTRVAAARLENELNTCYYVVATQSQLKEHQIIETGFLRKSKLLEGDFDKGFFVIADKRNLSTINLNSGKAKIYTNHPEDSYEITEVNKNKILTITNPEKFWSLTNYLVVRIN